jgi:glyoxylase-like metal-dependent hydrolase (beta-lactamase superfamily II)/rhodanese-related sulfurtransferase
MSQPAAPEIPATELERELGSGAAVVVIDVRERDAFEGWHLDPGSSARITNVPEHELEANPAAALADVPADVPVRVICNAGVTSRRMAGVLAALRPGVASISGGMIGWSRVLTSGPVPLPGPAQVVQFRREARGCLSYLVAGGGRALVVDPAPDVDPYLDAAERLGAPVVAVLDTHVHADHLSGARELAERTGATLYVSGAALARGFNDPQRFTPVDDGEQLDVGADVRVLALPGHTTDMIGLLVDGRALIAGDSVFADSVARPDLEMGDAGAEDAARQLYRTLRTRVLTLPAETVLLPCHYPGGRVGGPIAPTLADVRRAIPELEAGEDEFVRFLLASMPSRPANYEQIIAANLGESSDDEANARLEVGANNCAVSRAWAGG